MITFADTVEKKGYTTVRKLPFTQFERTFLYYGFLFLPIASLCVITECKDNKNSLNEYHLE